MNTTDGNHRAAMNIGEVSYRLVLASTRLAYGLAQVAQAERTIAASGRYLARVQAIHAAGETAMTQPTYILLGLAAELARVAPKFAASLITKAAHLIGLCLFYAPLSEAELQQAIRVAAVHAQVQAEAEFAAVFRKVLYRQDRRLAANRKEKHYDHLDYCGSYHQDRHPTVRSLQRPVCGGRGARYRALRRLRPPALRLLPTSWQSEWLPCSRQSGRRLGS